MVQLTTDSSAAVLQAYEYARSDPSKWRFWKRGSSEDVEANIGTPMPALPLAGLDLDDGQDFHEDDYNGQGREERYQDAGRRLLPTIFPRAFYPIIGKSTGSDGNEPSKYVLNVAALQACSIRLCQMEIVEAAKGMVKGDVDGYLPERIHRYCQALRDMDYMQEKAKDGFEHDPFLIMTSRRHERGIMNHFGLISRTQMDLLPEPIDKEHPILPGVGRTARLHAARKKTKLYNVLSALFGGLALIVPMIIMKLVPTRTCVLTTTCGFVLGFALAIAFWSNLKHGEILAVTAGYAAVLVVFVGTTSQ